MKPAIFCWSGGKDSALCLYRVFKEKQYEVKYLLTTVSEQFHRVSMHGVMEELLDAQAKSIGIPLVKIYISEGTNTEYEKKMHEVLLRFQSEGISHIIFGDIFLENLRKYREENLSKAGMTGVFPLWKQNTRKLIEEFLALKFKTVVCCTNNAYLGKEWAGIIIDEKFLSQLPLNVDACGENGEFHTFCFEGPVFKTSVKISIGEKIYKPLEIKTTDGNAHDTKTQGFWFCELLENQ